MKQSATERVRLAVVARELARIGCIGDIAGSAIGSASSSNISGKWAYWRWPRPGCWGSIAEW
jgi:hypothetical protein